MDGIGKIFIILGILILIFGVILSLGFKGMPGDLYIKRDNVSYYFPIASSILFSIILSVILYFISRR